MGYVFAAFVLGIIIYVFSKFKKEMSDKNTELEKIGGLKNKYKELIMAFEDFDAYNKPKILSDKTNDYELGWMGPSTISQFWLSEVNHNLWVKFTLDYNKENLRKNGVNINELPPLKEQLEWKFVITMDQSQMVNTVIRDIEKLMQKYGA